MQHTKAVVMAGGEGSRLRPITLERPKPLAPVANRPIMEHILLLLKRQGVTQAAATVFYRGQDIEDYFGDGSAFGMEMVYTHEDRPLGTAGAVRLAADFLGDDPFLIISGDALTDYDLRPAMEFHRQRGSAATLVLARVPNPKEFGIVVTSEDGRIQKFLEKPDWSEVFTDTVNTGIYIIEPEVLRGVEPGRPVDWSQDVFPRLLASGAPIYGYIMPSGYWSDIGTLEQFHLSQLDVLNREVEVEMPGEEIQPGIWVGEGAIVSPGAELTAPCLIGAQARIKPGARIGPGAVVGPGCIVEEGARIDSTLVMSGAYVGAESELRSAIIGERCLVKRGVRVGDGAVIGDRSTLDTGSEVRPGVKVWPDKVVERGARLSASLIAGRRWQVGLFRSQGVAGISNIEITPDFAVRLGLAYGSSLPLGSLVVSARDSTRSSRMSKRAFMSGLLSAGVNVIDMQSSPVPITRHHISALRAAGGANIRKFPTNTRLTLVELFDETGCPIAPPRQRKVEALFHREDFRRADSEELGEMNYSGRAVDMYVSDFLERLPKGYEGVGLNLVLDYGYSSIARMFPQVLADLDIHALSLNAVNDGKKAPRTAQRVQSHLEGVRHIVESLRYDFGVLVTHEGERFQAIDAQGRVAGAFQIVAVLARLLGPENPGGIVVVPASAPRQLAEVVREAGMECRSCGLAEADLMVEARRLNAVLAGDDSGGIILPGLSGGCDAMFAIVQLAVRLGQAGLSLRQAIESLPPLETSSLQARCPWDAKGQVMRRLMEEGLGGFEREHQHGIRFTSDEGWILVSPDAFEPLFHVFAEGSDSSASRRLAERTRIRIEELLEE